MEIIRDVHRGIGDSEHSKEWPHIEKKNIRYKKIPGRFFWHNIAAGINDYVKRFQQCQRQGNLKSPKVELKLIPVPSRVMKQVGVDICNLPEVDGYCHVIVLIDYFSKWLEVKPTKDKSLSFCTR